MQVKNRWLGLILIMITGYVVAAPVVFNAGTTIYVSGSTSQTPALAKTISAFCNTTVTTYTDDADGLSGLVYYCSNVNAMSGLTAGSSLLVLKSESSSWNGIKQVQMQSTSTYPDLNNCVNGAAVPVTYNATNVTGTLAGTCAYKNNTGLQTTSQVAIYDVPRLALIYANLVNDPLPTTGRLPVTISESFAGQGYGIAVSDALYFALQKEQILEGGLAANCAGISAPGTCQPSIPKDQYAAIIALKPGNSYQQSWAKLMPELASYALSSDPVLTNPVNLCRRNSTTSGTEVISEIYFLKTPCNIAAASTPVGALSPVRGGSYDRSGNLSSSSGLAAVFNVTESTSTGAVKSCLTANPSAYAIGVMSLQNLQPASGWKWLKLDGISPNIDAFNKANIVSGAYDFADEVGLMYSTNTGIPPAVTTFSKSLISFLGNGANLTNIPGIYADYRGGVQALPYPTFVPGQTAIGFKRGSGCGYRIDNF